MKFPDKPIATAGIGVACALALLVLLSWPALYGATNSANYITSGVPVANSGTTVYETASSTSQLVSSATAVETTMSTIAAGSNIDNTSHGSAPSSVSIESATTMASKTTIMTTVVNQGGTTVANLEPSPTAQPLIAFNYGAIAGSSSGSSHYSAFITLAVISIAALIIAIGSMLFVSRRVNSGKVDES